MLLKNPMFALPSINKLVPGCCGPQVFHFEVLIIAFVRLSTFASLLLAGLYSYRGM